MSLAAKLLSASGGAEDKLYVDDVFSAFTYTGNGSTQTINNGIDLAGKGGMVWIKSRTSAGSHGLVDTVRGRNKVLLSEQTTDQYTTPAPYDVTGFSVDGFSIGGNNVINCNVSGNNYASWTFRKAPKFFDVVTYTGNGSSSRSIAHSLGQEVGMVMTKATSTAGDWNTYHRSATGDLVLNTTAVQTGSKALVNSATTTTFTVSGAANTNAVTYVAYLFAHDTSVDGLIQCGSFTTDGSGNATVPLGFEPQYLMVKPSLVTGNWLMLDTQRGWADAGESEYDDAILVSNLSYAESMNNKGAPTATGFKFYAGGVSFVTYIYLAIRRPNKPPTTGTEVYNAIARTGTGAAATVTGVGFAPDLVHVKLTNNAASNLFSDRLRGSTQGLYSDATSAESTDNAQVTNFTMDGMAVGVSSTVNAAYPYINHFFKRAPGFFDVVCYTGTGVARTVPHSLGVAPELMIVKRRNAGYGWLTYAQPIGAANILLLNTTMASTSNSSGFNSTSPTASVFSVGTAGDSNESAGTYVAYLFATLPGISKVGSYTGNGTSQTINCGFTTGARFILIKRTDSTGDWYIWDTARGIVSANDPHLSLNTTAVEVTTDDSVDPDVSGFIVNQVAATNINVSGGQYIFLSIA